MAAHAVGSVITSSCLAWSGGRAETEGGEVALMRNLSLPESEAAAVPVKGGPAGPSAASREAASLTGRRREATSFRWPDRARLIGRGRSSRGLRTA